MSEEDIGSDFSFKYMLSVNAILPLTKPYHFIGHSFMCSSVDRSVDDVTFYLITSQVTKSQNLGIKL